MSKFLLLSLLIITGCQTLPPTTTQPTPPVTPPTKPSLLPPSATFAWDSKPDGKKWSEFALNESAKLSALMTVTLKDAKDYCPNYNKFTQAQRQVFWTHWVSELAKWESNHNPKSFMYECRKDRCVYGSCSYDAQKGYCMKGGAKADGGYVVSRGLTQMSLASSIALGCDVKTPQDLHDPFKNIQCALRGMNRWAARDQSLFDIDGDNRWGGCSAYFAVCRGTNDYTRKAKAAISKAVGKTKGCF